MENMEEEDIKFEPDKSIFLLKTNSACFLCLGTNYDFNDGNGNQDEVNRVSLLSIFRYLGMSLKDLFSNSLKDDGIFPEKISNCSVTLCEGCASITSKLSGLCTELELIQMRVDHCLQAFQDELEDSEMDRVRVERFRQMKMGNLDNIHVEIAEMLRKKMKKQCDMKLNSILPKVVIGDRTKVPNGRVPSAQNVKTATGLASSPNHLETPKSEYSSDESEIEDNLETLSEDDYETQLKSTKNYTQTQGPKPPSKKSPRTRSRFENGRLRYNVTCKLCKPALVIAGSTLQNHQVRAHLDVLMISFKLPNISQDDFKVYCDHVFKVETMASQKGVSNFDCQYCPINYRTHSTLRNHFFKEHKEVLSKKIIELQKSSTVEEIQSVKLPSVAKADETWNCEDCGKNFTSKEYIKVHKMNHCKLEWKDWKRKVKKPKNNHNGETTTCQNCDPPQQISVRGFRYHQVRTHPDFLLKPYKLPNISKEDFKVFCAHVLKMEAVSSRKEKDKTGKLICYCSHCTQTYTSHEYLRIHLFCLHEQVLGEKLVELQKSKSAGDLTKMKLPTIIIYQPTKCAKCGVTVVGRPYLRDHINFHCKFGPKKKRIGKKVGKVRNLDGVGSPEPEVSIEIDNDGDEKDLHLKCEDGDGVEEGIEGNVGDLQQGEIMDVDIEKDGFVVKTERYNENLDVILPDIPEDDPLKL